MSSADAPADDHGVASAWSDVATGEDRASTWARRLLFASAGAIVVAPLVAAIVAWRKGWMPFGDDAAVVAQAWGTLSSQPPLLGNYSTVSGVTDASQTLYHPGPMQLWLLAGPLHLFAPSNVGALLGTAVLVSAALAVVLLAAWRHGGAVLAAPTVVMVAWLLFVVGAQPLRSPYMGSVAMLMFLGLIGAGWAVMNRDDWFWPAAVVFASIAVQAQVSFSVPVAMVACAIALGRVVVWRRDRRAGSTGRPRRPRVVGAVTVLAALGCWAGPLYDQFFGAGNLWALITAGSGADAAGPSWAVNRLVDTLALPPAWTVGKIRIEGGLTAAGEAYWHTPGAQYVTAALFLVVWVGLFVWAVRGRRRALATFGVIGWAALAGAFVAAWLMPSDPTSLIGHNQSWLIGGFTIWCFPVLAVSVAVSELFRDRVSSPARWGPGATAFAACGALVLVVAVLARSSPAHDVSSNGFGAVAHFAEAGMDVCTSAGGPVIVTQDGYGSILTTVGVVAQLQIEGCDVRAGRGLETTLSGAWFRPTGNETVTLRVGRSPTGPPGFRLLDSYDPLDPPPAYRGFDGIYSGLQNRDPMYLHLRKE